MAGKSVALRKPARGAVAGAAGTTALNAVTYLDMAVRARPASKTPEQAVTELAERSHLPIPGGEPARENRICGLGAMRVRGCPRYPAQVVVAGLAAADWAGDLVPHFAYGVVAAGVLVSD